MLLAPFVGAFVGALAMPGYYWTEWRIYFSSEALAFLTLPPALLSWLTPPLMQTRRSSRSWLEVATVTVASFPGGCPFLLVLENGSSSAALFSRPLPSLGGPPVWFHRR